MRLLKHHEVSLHRHVEASFGTAFATATIVSLFYCALLPFSGPAMGHPQVNAAVLLRAFGQSWVPTALFSLALSAVIFSAMRMAFNRLGANLGFLYVATGASLVASFMAFAPARKDELADSIGIFLGAAIGLSIGCFYWLFATRAVRQPACPDQPAAGECEASPIAESATVSTGPVPSS